MPCGVASFGAVFKGFSSRLEEEHRSVSIPAGPNKIFKIAELQGQLQHQQFNKLNKPNAQRNVNRTVQNYDETCDILDKIDSVGNNAADVRRKGSKKDRFHNLHSTLGSGRVALSGEERLYTLNKMVLTEFEYTLFVFQKQFFNNILRCIAPMVVGEEEWNRRGSAIMKHFGWKSIGRMTIATASRRNGKTQALAYVIAAISLVMKCTIGFFASGKRASEGAKDAFLNAIHKSKYAKNLPDRGFGAETIYIQTEYGNEGDISMVMFFPHSEQIRILFLSLVVFCVFIFFVSKLGTIVPRK